MNDEQPAQSDTEALQKALAEAKTYLGTLPTTERTIASLAAKGMPVWEIAQTIGISEAAVSRTLDGVYAAITGREITPVETGGVGSDTDAGVTGGYGDTGFGALDTEPIPDNREPAEG